MGAEPWILGIGGSHTGSVCLLRGSRIVVAIQAERVSGQKREWLWAAKVGPAIRYCLQTAGIGPDDLDVLAISALPSVHDPRHDLTRNPVVGDVARRVPVVRVGHHLAHAASAYALSGFAEAAILVVDGAGTTAADLDAPERAVADADTGSEAISMYAARGRDIAPLAKQMVAGPDGWLAERTGPGMRRFGTLGGMYSAVAEQVFGDVHAAGKVMGLAPCGDPTIPTEEFLVIEDGRPRFTGDVVERFGHDDRWPQRRGEYADLAASVQAALEVALGAAVAEVGERAAGHANLCYAGGVALNVVANDRIVRAGPFDDVFVVPAAEDSGVAIGAAYLGLWRTAADAADDRPRRLRRDSLGRTYGDEEVAGALTRLPGLAARRTEDVVGEACARLDAGQVVGWFQGGAEIGPRALGHRSLLCDPRDPKAKARLNARVKYREPFRPFAPLLPEEAVPEWFDAPDGATSPFMLSALPFREEAAARVPAVVHVDGSGRLQTVRRDDEPLLHALLERWRAVSGVPVLLNTSFNLAGEPIVETPEDALRCLLSSRVDAVIAGSWVAERRAPVSLLDLVPVRIGVPVNGASGAYAAATPWGTTVVELAPSEAAVLAAANGVTTGRELVREQAPHLDERGAVRLVHRLCRLRLARPVGAEAIVTPRTSPTASFAYSYE